MNRVNQANIDFIIKGLDFGSKEIVESWRPILMEIERRLKYLSGKVYLTRLANNGVGDSYSRLRIIGSSDIKLSTATNLSLENSIN